MREVFNVKLKRCAQPTSIAEARSRAESRRSVGFVNAPGVPAPEGANVPDEQQQTADELWGPVPNVGVVDHFAGGDLSPQHTQATTISGVPIAEVQQPDVRRPRIEAYAKGQIVYMITYETKELAEAGLVSSEVEAQWSKTGVSGRA